MCKGQSIDTIDFDLVDSVVGKLGFFERFTKSTRVNILKLGTYSKLPPGEYIFHQGDYGENLYIILRGSVLVKIDKQFEEGLVVK
jgi:CRP-like cAMP-binding protein